MNKIIRASHKKKFIDLFCGLGAFRIGLEKNNFECVFSSDNNKNVQEATSRRRPMNVNTSKDEIPNTEELRQRNRAIANQQSNQQVETIIRSKPKVGRNDKVTIKNIKTAEKKEMKYKHAEKLVNSGEWMIIGNG